MPGYEVFGFTGSWESTDALHCRAKGIPDLDLLQIFHHPLNDVDMPVSDYQVTAVIDDETGISSASLFYTSGGSSVFSNASMSGSGTTPI